MLEVAKKRDRKHVQTRTNLHANNPKNANGAKERRVSPEKRNPATPKSVAANAADAALNQRGQERSVAAAGLYTPVKVNANLVM